MNPECFKAPDGEKETPCADSKPPSAFSSPAAGNGHRGHADAKILRFAKSERILHWCIAGPFLISFGTGVLLAIIYNPDPTRPWRGAFASLHRISGVALGIFPMVALLIGRHDVRIHLYNIRQAWIWVYDDFKWLALMGLAAISSRFELPEQGKFNAAEKLNFMVLMSTYPLYVATGLLMWLTHLAVLSWILHCLMAMLATPLILGHLYMALINADTRVGLEGMISGHVDREWAKHHYRRWYRSHHEATDTPLPAQPSFTSPAGPEPVDIAPSGILKAAPPDNANSAIAPVPETNSVCSINESESFPESITPESLIILSRE